MNLLPEPASERMPLKEARTLAETIASAISKHCVRLDIAGSIRRQTATCGDIDLVCLPLPGARQRILDRCLAKSALIKNGDQYAVLRLANGFQLDLWFAHAGVDDMFAPEPSNYGVLLLARTGSADFNTWVATKAKARGLHFHPHKGVLHGSRIIASVNEADVFEAIGIRFVAPEDRK